MRLDDALLDTESSAWARFLGTHLPPRALDLRFELLPPHRRGEAPLLDPRRLRQLALERNNNIGALLKGLTEQMRLLNRYRLPPKRRFSLAEVHLSLLFPAANALVQRQIKEPGGIPENAQRAELLNAVASAFQALVTAYQIIIAADYDRGRFWYARVRGRVHRCAHRIIDLIGLVQQVNALRYQRLSDANWRVANTVFCVMLDCEQVDIPLDSPGSLMSGGHSSGPASIRERYAALHVPWVLDFLCWPEAQLPVVLHYARSIQDGVRIFPADTSVCGTHQALTRCYRAAEPTPGAKQRPGGEGDGPTILIDYQILASQVSADFKELIKARAARNPFLLPRRFASIGAGLQLTVAHRMMRLVEPRLRQGSPNTPSEQQEDLRIHVGFDEVYAHLQTIFSTDGRLAARRQLSNLFAQRSALIGEDHTAAEESRWHVMQELSDRVRLRTQETRYTTPIVIGSLMVYGHGEDGIRTPALGKVERIFRPEARTVLVDVMAFAEYARPVTLRSADDQIEASENSPTRGLLVHARDKGWGLMLPDQTRFWTGTKVSVDIGGRVRALRLSELRDIGEGYALFGVDTRSGERVAPSYPNNQREQPGSGFAAAGYFGH